MRVHGQNSLGIVGKDGGDENRIGIHRFQFQVVGRITTIIEDTQRKADIALDNQFILPIIQIDEELLNTFNRLDRGCLQNDIVGAIVTFG